MVLIALQSFVVFVTLFFDFLHVYVFEPFFLWPDNCLSKNPTTLPRYIVWSSLLLLVLLVLVWLFLSGFFGLYLSAPIIPPFYRFGYFHHCWNCPHPQKTSIVTSPSISVSCNTCCNNTSLPSESSYNRQGRRMWLATCWMTGRWWRRFHSGL